MNPNDYVRIRPTEHGWEEIRGHVATWNQRHGTDKFQLTAPTPDAQGYIRGQFWCLMEYFDWGAGAGHDCHFHDMQIEPKHQ